MAQPSSLARAMESARERLPLADWPYVGRQVSGPLITLAAVIGLDILTRSGILVTNPFPILLVCIVWAALRGGLWPSVVSATIVVLYAVHFFSETGHMLRYSTTGLHGLIFVMLAAPAVALLVSLVPRRVSAVPALRGADRMAGGSEAERRALLLAEADHVLSISNPEAALQGLIRLLVPTMADWCAVHLIDAEGKSRYAATADRDPVRESQLQRLRRYPPPILALWHRRGAATAASELIESVSTEDLRRLAPNGEHRELLNELAPRSIAVVPLSIGGDLLGALTAITTDSRTLGPTDLFYLEQVAARAAAAIDLDRLHRALTAAEDRYRLLFEDHPQPMWLFDTDTLAFLAVNQAALRHYGYTRDEFLAMSIMDIRPSEETTGVLHADWAATGRDEVALTQHQRSDGSVIDVEITSHEVAFGAGRARLVQITDVTDRARTRAALHRSEEHLRQAQKMDALGRLAGGIAHDFNNLLTAIRGYSEMLLRDLPDDSNHRGDIDRIRQAADRGALLTRQLLALGSRQVLQPKAVDLNDVLAEMETLLQRLVGAEVRLGLVPTPGIGHVKIDPGQLEQVILNLVLNARDAMTGGGTLMIETSERNIRAPGRSRHVRPGRYVVLAVTDSGAGMDEETRTRMFEPFFTTKAANGGAGLGLSIVYGIVRQNGGVIRIASEPGSGTTVKVYLPRCVDCDEAAPSVEAPSHNGVETILLVEDEEAVRELLRKVLVHQGYTVLEARHGRDALLLLEEYRGPLDLVVTDVVMPEMGGREMVEHMLTARPDLQVLYISGYANEQLTRRGVSEPEVSFIQKPFSSDEFVRKVRGLLDAVPPAI